jgi:alpha-glucosidase
MELKLEPNEWWWGGRVVDAGAMPCGVGAPGKFTLAALDEGNQAQPLLVSSTGRFVWNEQPFAFEIDGDVLRLAEASSPFTTGRGGRTLAEGFRAAAQRFFPAAGTMPAPEMFSVPQYNTWIELLYDQREERILEYARTIVAQGYPPGVLMIDDNWQEDYGDWDFSARRFKNPKRMVDELHALGFEVMLWVCPFVSADSAVARALQKDGLLLRDAPAGSTSGGPAAIRWWNGISAVLDLSNPRAEAWFKQQLRRLQDVYGIDGFKFDAGDTGFYVPPAGRTYRSHAPRTPEEHTLDFARIGLDFPFNEYRAGWKLGGQPLAQRLRDKEHTWAALRELIPGIIAQGLIGYAFTCPDLIGGGHAGSFEDASKFDPELVVRSAQVHALMPMMQFSVAPWRVLSAEQNLLCRAAAKLHAEFGEHFVSLAREAARTGEPIIRPLAWQWPGRELETVKDQFLAGDALMVAPVLEKGARRRSVVFPPGRWRGDDGAIVEGEVTREVDAPLSRLPYFRKMN